ncbi:hypothetical protein D3C87_2157660 [compost metagenome]
MLSAKEASIGPDRKLSAMDETASRNCPRGLSRRLAAVSIADCIPENAGATSA